jgi:hypothetical protein
VASSFSLQIAEFVKTVKAREDLVVRKLGLDILSSVVRMSPVDTGRFRGNWQVGLNAPVAGQLARLDKSGAVTIAAGNQILSHASAGGVIYLNNNLPYAQRLEYGWSKQAPSGMVRITAAFVPSGTYLRPWLLPAPTEAMTLSAAGPNDYRGIFQVSVFAAVDAGPTAPLETASAIAAHFKRGTRLTRDGINVWMDDPSWVGPMIQEPDVLQLPVSVPYRAFVSNA